MIEVTSKKCTRCGVCIDDPKNNRCADCYQALKRVRKVMWGALIERPALADTVVTLVKGTAGTAKSLNASEALKLLLANVSQQERDAIEDPRVTNADRFLRLRQFMGLSQRSAEFARGEINEH